jgi:hypothetical protein
VPQHLPAPTTDRSDCNFAAAAASPPPYHDPISGFIKGLMHPQTILYQVWQPADDQGRQRVEKTDLSP